MLKRLHIEEMMKKINTAELKEMWKEFFEKRGFKEIKNSSLIPENDATVLFTMAGMHPLVPYLKGEAHPLGSKLFNVQRCIRTNDIESVGDSSHCTFFEMLGNWTLGECDKEWMIDASFEFLTSKKYLGIDKNNLAVSVFEGDETAPRDIEGYNAWKKCGLKDSQIFFLSKEDNWWVLGGGVGPCGPDTEMFIDMGTPKCSKNCSPACSCGKYLEIWNNVFMEYIVREPGGKIEKLLKPNIDTGMGVERTICALNNVKSVFDIGVLKQAVDLISNNTEKKYLQSPSITRNYRIIADHIRSAVMILADGVLPATSAHGYILRRLIRRAINSARAIELSYDKLLEIAMIYIDNYKTEYPNVMENQQKILLELEREIKKFEKTITQGHKEFEKIVSDANIKIIDGKTAFRLYDTFGFPIELTKEMAKELGIGVDEEGFRNAFAEHQEKSRVAAAGLFKGGLADTSEMTTRLHTATHLLITALRKFHGSQIEQRGSNITPERLRLDFNFDRKLLPEELKVIEDEVNEYIKKAVPVTCEEMPISKAKQCGAVGIFDDKYGETVKVYTIGNISKEICGGPHVSNTAELKKFIIQKEESSSAGIRRIKAILQD
jgi:alanyl-tRNA synthetase